MNLRRVLETGHPRPQRVVVVGGGAAGTLAAGHLVRGADHGSPVEVTVIDRRGEFGPGAPYTTRDPLHTVNNFAARLSAVAGDPDHLVRWCRERGDDVGPTGFLQRGRYGDYLTEVFDQVTVPAGSALGRVHATVVDLTLEEGRWRVWLADGRRLAADHVVLALGSGPARQVAAYRRLAERTGATYVGDPWAPDLTDQVAGARRVLLVGTGLTAVDVAAVLHREDPGRRMVAVSRTGLLPEPHAPGGSRLHDIFHPGTTSLVDLLESIVRRTHEVAEVGGDWRDVVDSVRGSANDLWQGFTDEEQDRFVNDLARTWEIARHRMPPAMARRVVEMRRTGVLDVRAAHDLDDLAGRPGGTVDVVVGCAGPSPVPTRGWNPLVDVLLDGGHVRAHRLGLGLDLTRDGNPVGADGVVRGSLHVVGAARRGLEWEVSAVPDLRLQSARLADRLLAGSAANGPTEVATGG